MRSSLPGGRRSLPPHAPKDPTPMTADHLMHRPHDWPTATDDEWTAALLDTPRPIEPRFMAYARNHRAHCLRRALLLHADTGGFLGAPAKRFLRGGR